MPSARTKGPTRLSESPATAMIESGAASARRSSKEAGRGGTAAARSARSVAVQRSVAWAGLTLNCTQRTHCNNPVAGPVLPYLGCGVGDGGGLDRGNPWSRAGARDPWPATPESLRVCRTLYRQGGPGRADRAGPSQARRCGTTGLAGVKGREAGALRAGATRIAGSRKRETRIDRRP